MIRQLARERSPEVEATVLGIEGYQRTPLHVDFSALKHTVDEGYEPVRELKRPLQCKDETFNAVGSWVIGSDAHLPVLDLDYGISNVEREGAGFVIGCRGESKIDPASVLKDVIRGNGLGSVELFDGKSLNASGFGGYHLSSHISAMRWRPENEDDFVWVGSTSSHRGHLYIQKPIPDTDHSELLRELASVGALGSGWMRVVKDSGGGVVRTPWIAKDQFHRVS